MKITQNKTTTTIFVEDVSADKIREIIDGIESIKGCEIKEIEYGFLLSVVLTDYQKVKIKRAFRKVESKKGIITGFKGCCVTGFKFEWL